MYEDLGIKEQQIVGIFHIYYSVLYLSLISYHNGYLAI